MVSDQELASCVESLLRQGCLSAVTSFDDMVHQLEAKFGMDLSHKTSFIHQQIDILLSPHLPQLPPASSSESRHFSHLPQTSQGMEADAAGALPEELNHRQCLPPPVAAPAPASKESVPAAPKRRGGPGGLSKICGVSPELQVIVGEPTMARTEIVKKLWAYIRKNNLQDPNNKRKIICNDELRVVFETDSTDMFKMNKLLAKHIIALEPSKEPGSDSKRLKRSDTEVDASLETQANQYPPVVISDALAEFLGMGEREILQSDALKRIWDYVKAKRLEDSVTNMILCDTKLRQLFGCESLFASDVSEMLARHLFKQS